MRARSQLRRLIWCLDDGDPHLVAAGMHKLQRPILRSAQCMSQLFASEFAPVDSSTEGHVRAFTRVKFAAPGIPTHVSRVGGRLRPAPRCEANLVNVRSRS